MWQDSKIGVQSVFDQGGNTRKGKKMRSTSRPATVIGYLLAVFGVCFGLWAQERFSEINGVVTDPSGAAIPNATVTLTNKDTNRSVTLRSGSDGSYLATNIEPG